MTAQHGIDSRRCAEQREPRLQTGVGQAATKAARYIDDAQAPVTLLHFQVDANEALNPKEQKKTKKHKPRGSVCGGWDPPAGRC